MKFALFTVKAVVVMSCLRWLMMSYDVYKNDNITYIEFLWRIVAVHISPGLFWGVYGLVTQYFTCKPIYGTWLRGLKYLIGALLLGPFILFYPHVVIQQDWEAKKGR